MRWICCATYWPSTRPYRPAAGGQARQLSTCIPKGRLAPRGRPRRPSAVGPSAGRRHGAARRCHHPCSSVGHAQTHPPRHPPPAALHPAVDYDILSSRTQRGREQDRGRVAQNQGPDPRLITPVAAVLDVYGRARVGSSTPPHAAYTVLVCWGGPPHPNIHPTSHRYRPLCSLLALDRPPRDLPCFSPCPSERTTCCSSYFTTPRPRFWLQSLRELYQQCRPSRVLCVRFGRYPTWLCRRDV